MSCIVYILYTYIIDNIHIAWYDSLSVLLAKYDIINKTFSINHVFTQSRISSTSIQIDRNIHMSEYIESIGKKQYIAISTITCTIVHSIYMCIFYAKTLFLKNIHCRTDETSLKGIFFYPLNVFIHKFRNKFCLLLRNNIYTTFDRLLCLIVCARTRLFSLTDS